jgi:hypothetical protein
MLYSEINLECVQCKIKVARSLEFTTATKLLQKQVWQVQLGTVFNLFDVHLDGHCRHANTGTCLPSGAWMPLF